MMRYALFSTKPEVDGFSRDIQAACDATYVPGTPRIIICPFQHYSGKWAVPMPTERNVLTLAKELVETVEPPIVKYAIEEVIAEPPKSGSI